MTSRSDDIATDPDPAPPPSPTLSLDRSTRRRRRAERRGGAGRGRGALRRARGTTPDATPRPRRFDSPPRLPDDDDDGAAGAGGRRYRASPRAHVSAAGRTRSRRLFPRRALRAGGRFFQACARSLRFSFVYTNQPLSQHQGSPRLLATSRSPSPVNPYRTVPRTSLARTDEQTPALVLLARRNLGRLRRRPDVVSRRQNSISPPEANTRPSTRPASPSRKRPASSPHPSSPRSPRTSPRAAPGRPCPGSRCPRRGRRRSCRPQSACPRATSCGLR